MAAFLPSRTTWKDLTFWKSDEWKNIQKTLETEDFLPKKSDIFRALVETSLEDTRVVILGQDPYHTPGMAHGLAFSVPTCYNGGYPPTLINILRELKSDTGIVSRNGCLTPWARQGVLLLNTRLTVKPRKPMSHAGIGWERLTREIIEFVAEENSNTVFIFWGLEAQDFGKFCRKNPKVWSSHPSPYSANISFFGSRPFTRVNALLKEGHQGEIDWSLKSPESPDE